MQKRQRIFSLSHELSAGNEQAHWNWRHGSIETIQSRCAPHALKRGDAQKILASAQKSISER